MRPNGLEDTPQLAMTVDRVQAQSMGLSLTDVYTAIQLMLAPVYVERFRLRRPRAAREHAGRCAVPHGTPDALSHFYVPSATGPSRPQRPGRRQPRLPPMIPLSNVVQHEMDDRLAGLVRYNGYEAIEIVGSQAPGKSTGEAMDAMQDIIKNDLPHGFGFDWTGQSLQEILSGNQAPMLYALSILVVFLCLAALYESWSIPVAVLLVVPLGVTGALLLTWLRPGGLIRTTSTSRSAS